MHLFRSLLLLLLMLFWVPLPAHELGAMRVTVSFLREGTWQADIVVDLAHIPQAMQPMAAASAEERKVWSRAFLAACSPAFDGRPAPMDRAVFQGVKEGQPTQWQYHLEGAIPPGAKTFTWAHNQNLGAFLVTLQHQGDAFSASQC